MTKEEVDLAGKNDELSSLTRHISSMQKIAISKGLCQNFYSFHFFRLVCLKTICKLKLQFMLGNI